MLATISLSAPLADEAALQKARRTNQNADHCLLTYSTLKRLRSCTSAQQSSVGDPTSCPVLISIMDIISVSGSGGLRKILSLILSNDNGIFNPTWVESFYEEIFISGFCEQFKMSFFIILRMMFYRTKTSLFWVIMVNFSASHRLDLSIASIKVENLI